MTIPPSSAAASSPSEARFPSSEACFPPSEAQIPIGFAHYLLLIFMTHDNYDRSALLLAAERII